MIHSTGDNELKQNVFEVFNKIDALVAPNLMKEYQRISLRNTSESCCKVNQD